MKQLKNILSVFVVLLFGCGTAAAQDGDKILGTYRVIGMETKEPSNVKIYKNGNTYEAQIIWLERPNDKNGKPRLDVLNPDPALRSVRGDKVVIVKGLKYNAKHNKWIGGRIYNPVTGKTYDAMAEFDSPTKLKMKGYLGTPAFGKNFIWTKLK